MKRAVSSHLSWKDGTSQYAVRRMTGFFFSTTVIFTVSPRAIHHIMSNLISSASTRSGGSIYPWCNIYTYTCWTYSPHTSDRLIFTRVKSSHGSSRLRQTKCWHVLPAVFPALYMADQPWMSRLTGPAAARCVSSTLNKAKTSPVSLNRVRDWRSNGSACLLCQSVLSIPTMLR